MFVYFFDTLCLLNDLMDFRVQDVVRLVLIVRVTLSIYLVDGDLQMIIKISCLEVFLLL